MGYKNAIKVLPADLLEAIQKHVDGEYIYIPRKSENRKHWGEIKNSQQHIRARNEMILFKYQGGISVEDIAGSVYLSPKTIYKILADMRRRV